MAEIRKIKTILKSKPTIEGAGVHLKRVFGYPEVPLFDPFLLLDDFGSNNPDDYMAGFPWHPHRGIETVTYMLTGRVEHGDSMGNKGVIRSGDVQWMTAGSGIIHQEMPQKLNGNMRGFQLWVNLPSTHKMMAPRYQDVTKDQIPELSQGRDVKIKIICGEMDNVKGPVQDIVVDSEYLDITLSHHTVFEKQVKEGYTTFVYVIDGAGYFYHDKKELLKKDHLALFDDGSMMQAFSGTEPFRFLLLSGKPLAEPVAWSGPIVMNSREELRLAFQEYQDGNFVK